MIRILDDKNIPSQTTLTDLLSGINLAQRIVKGPRKPKSMMNPCFTLHVLTNPRDPDSKAHNGTLLVNFYVNNYTDGNANIELLGPVAARLVRLFDDKPIIVFGWRVYDFHVQEPLGPLQDPAFPDESFMSVRIKFGMIANSL